MDVEILPVVALPADSLAPLIAESEREGWKFVRRLSDEWVSGVNRFDRLGEKLFVARREGMIVGVCGLNADPYSNDESIGRVRRLYVLPVHRGQGIGQMLVQAVIHAASGRFKLLRLRTNNPDAGRLYERLGFQAVQGFVDCTHTLELRLA